MSIDNFSRKTVIISAVLLLLWFILDMTGLYIGDKYLVTRSYKDDGIFFAIYTISLILFLTKEKIGKWVLLVTLSIWALLQFLGHEWYTIFGSGVMGTLEGKIKYFEDAVKLIEVDGRYIPDLYHIVLHLLILASIISLIYYMARGNKK